MFFCALIRNDQIGDLHEDLCQREGKYGRDDTDDRVHQGDLSYNIVWSHGLIESVKRQNGIQNDKEYGTEDVVDEVDDRNTLGIAVETQRCQHGRRTGSDLLAEVEKHDIGDLDQSTLGQRLNDT